MWLCAGMDWALEMEGVRWDIDGDVWAVIHYDELRIFSMFDSSLTHCSINAIRIGCVSQECEKGIRQIGYASLLTIS